MTSCALSTRRGMLRRPKVCFTPPNPGRCEPPPPPPPPPPVCPPDQIVGHVSANWWTYPKPGPLQHFYESDCLALPLEHELLFDDHSEGTPGHFASITLSEIGSSVWLQISMKDDLGDNAFAISDFHDIVWCEHNEINLVDWTRLDPDSLELTFTIEW